MSIGHFPDTQTLTMQQEALKRVRDMQLRARQSVEQSNGYSSSPQQQQPLNSPQTLSSGHPSQAQAPPHQPHPPPQSQFPPQQQQPPSQNFSSQNMPPQNNGQQNPQQRQPNFSPPGNILSHLFGGNRQSTPPNNNAQQGDGQRGSSQSGQRSGGSGLLDLLRKQGLGDSVSGLGDTIQNTISSVSAPISGLLEGFGIDGEKMVILLVMWAIFNEHKDNKMLLMALGYLLL